MKRICPVCGRPVAEGSDVCFFCSDAMDPPEGETGEAAGSPDLPARGGEEKRPRSKSPYALMSPLQYFGSILLMLVPVVGVVVAVLWSLGYCRKENKRNLARAVLGLMSLFLLLLFLASFAFRPYWQKALYALLAEPSPPVVSALPAGSATPGVSGTPSPNSSLAESEIAGWDAGRPVAFSGFPSAQALNLLLGGEYYIKYTVFAFGSAQVREQAKSEGRFAQVETVSGKQIRVLTIDGVRYECDDQREVYCIAGQGTEGQTLPFGGTLAALERVGSGQGQVNGLECDYDEFALQGSGTGEVKRTVRLYVKDEVLQAIYMEEPLLGGQVMMQVQVLTKEIPKGMLEFPTTYAQVTYDEMVHPGATV